jgi:hypothetical protein
MVTSVLLKLNSVPAGFRPWFNTEVNHIRFEFWRHSSTFLICLLQNYLVVFGLIFVAKFDEIAEIRPDKP